MSADYQGEIRAGGVRGAGGSRRPGCGRWVGDPRLESSRRFTSLWIGTTAEVRLALTNLGRSPVVGRGQDGRGENGLTGAIQATLRDTKQRTGPPGNVWRY
jgi:hypothetical protein